MGISKVKIYVKDITKFIHKDGYILIAIFIGVTLFLGSLNKNLGLLGVVASAWCVFFFRNPDRVSPIDENLVLSPADGIVKSISESLPPSEFGVSEEKMLRISIFLNIFNVHVNRIPATGKILTLHYHPGKFFNASLDKASLHNERQSVLMETQNGDRVIFAQIAGLVARRIVCDLEEGNQVKAGERFGIIRFGSRVDVYLPIKTVPMVFVGQTCIGGETVLAEFVSTRPPVQKFETR